MTIPIQSPGWSKLIQSGDPQHDEQYVAQHRAAAQQQGLALHVDYVATGGAFVQALPPHLPKGPVPAAVAPRAAPPAPDTWQQQPAPPRYSAQGALAFAEVAVQPSAQMNHDLAAQSGCQVCGARRPTRQVTLRQNIGAIVVRFTRTLKGRLCKPCIRSKFWRYTTITFFLGWWGVASFVYTPVALIANIITLISSRKLTDS